MSAIKQTETAPGASQKRNRLSLYLDLAIFLGFLVAMAPHWSGIAVHEWLSIAFGAAIVLHLLLNWQWIAGVTKRFFSRVHWLARTNYVLNVALFIDMVIVIFTGILISEHVLLLLGITTARGGVWRGLHDASANIAVLLVGLHLALNWQWVVTAFRRYVVAARRRGGAVEAPRPTLPEV